MSSRRASIGNLTSGGFKGVDRARHDLEQPARVGFAEDRFDRYVPEAWVGSVLAFYGILLRHEHRQTVAEVELRRRERMMVGKWVFDDLEAAVAQVGEEAPGIANPGDGMHRPAAESLERLRLGRSGHPSRLARQ